MMSRLLTLFLCQLVVASLSLRCLAQSIESVPGVEFALADVAYGRHVFVAVGWGYLGKHVIVTSSNGVEWTDQSLPELPDGKLESVTFGDNQFVAAGRYGLVLTSGDGTTWTKQAVPSGAKSELFEDVAYGAGTYVIVGGVGTILTSGNGKQWEVQQSPISDWLNGVTWGNGRFVAVGLDGTIVSSADGVTWTKQVSGTDVTLNEVTFGAGTFVVVGWAGTTLTSVDGVKWTQHTSEFGTLALDTIACSSDLFLAAGGRAISISADGAHWKLPPGVQRTAPEYVPETETRVSYDGGATWISAWTHGGSDTHSMDLTGAAYGNGMFVVVGNEKALILRHKEKGPKERLGEVFVELPEDPGAQRKATSRTAAKTTETPLRTWTFKSGKTVEARFVSATRKSLKTAGGAQSKPTLRVILERQDGKRFGALYESLTPEDKKVVLAAVGQTKGVKKSGPRKDHTDTEERPARRPVSVSLAESDGPTLPASWPKMVSELSGGNEVRVKNPNGFAVTAGLRRGGLGRDFTIPPHGTESVHVQNGRYEIYFLYSNEPDSVYKGDDFQLLNNGVMIEIIRRVDGNYGIRKVN